MIHRAWRGPIIADTIAVVRNAEELIQLPNRKKNRKKTMISSAAIITSQPLTQSDYLTYLLEAGEKMGTPSLYESGFILDGAIDNMSQFWVRLASSEELGYKNKDLVQFNIILDAQPKSFIELEFNDGIRALSIVIKLVKITSTIFPTILDNGYGKIYSSKEILQITENSY